MIRSRLKRAWHRDVVSDPEIHGWVLNLYRAGERHPQTVEDYFPWAHAPWPELAQQLKHHAADEVRHARLYTAAIEQLGQPLVDVDVPDVFNHVIRKHTGLDLKISDVDDLDTRRLKLAHFLAHAHFLEKRVARSLEWHGEACEAARSSAVGVVRTVRDDEHRHVASTLEALRELLPSGEVEGVLAVHRQAERRANLDFSQRQVRTCAAHFAKSRRRALGYRLIAFLQREALAVV